jgi:hypothetical protein
MKEAAQAVTGNFAPDFNAAAHAANGFLTLR